MTLNVLILSPGFDGMTVDLYDATQATPGQVPPMPATLIAAGSLDGGRVSFDLTPPTQFALGVRDGDHYYLRSGRIGAADGLIDPDTGDLGIMYIAERAPLVEIDSDGLNDLRPNTPFEEDDLRVTSIGLDIVGTFLRATGTGTYDAGVWGKHDVTFEYDFDLEPVTDPWDTDRVVRVVTREVTVVGANPGLLGWLLNFVVMIVAAFNTGRLGQSMESGIQEAIDVAVASTFDDYGDIETLTGTINKLQIGVGGIEIDAWGAINGGAVGCASALSEGSVRLRPREQMRALRAFRASVLAGTPRGDTWSDLFRRLSPEVVPMMIRDRTLLRAADQLAAAVLARFDPSAPRAFAIDATMAKAAQEVIERLARTGSPGLRALAARASHELRELGPAPLRAQLEAERDALMRQLTSKEGPPVDRKS